MARKHPWTYPVASSYHGAMASFYSSEMSIAHFAENLMNNPTNNVSQHLMAHNLDLFAKAQADAISWASRV